MRSFTKINYSIFLNASSYEPEIKGGVSSKMPVFFFLLKSLGNTYEYMKKV